MSIYNSYNRSNWFFHSLTTVTIDFNVESIASVGLSVSGIYVSKSCIRFRGFLCRAMKDRNK